MNKKMKTNAPKGAFKKAIKNDIAQIFKKYNQGVKLDIGCGENKQGPDFIGMDIRPGKGVDIVQDLESFPWKDIPDNSINFAVASHVIEHINPARFGMIKFMDEVWRILKPGARFAIAVPYAGSQGYWQDPTHCNPCNEITWAYFDPMDRSGLWNIYKPKPWMIVPNTLSWNEHGFMELMLEKRLIDKKNV